MYTSSCKPRLVSAASLKECAEDNSRCLPCLIGAEVIRITEQTGHTLASLFCKAKSLLISRFSGPSLYLNCSNTNFDLNLQLRVVEEQSQVNHRTAVPV